MFPLCYSIENGKFVLNDIENIVVENFVGIEKTNELLSEMEKLYEKSTFHDFFVFSIDKSQIMPSTTEVLFRSKDANTFIKYEEQNGLFNIRT